MYDKARGGIFSQPESNRFSRPAASKSGKKERETSPLPLRTFNLDTAMEPLYIVFGHIQPESRADPPDPW